MADPDPDPGAGAGAARSAALLQARAAVPGGEALSDSEVEAAAEGLRALQAVLTAAAYPSVVGGLRAILAAAPLSGPAKAALARQIDLIPCPLGCLKFDPPGGALPLHVFMAGCPAGHDTSAQLRRLRDGLGAAAWDDARKKMGHLLLLARQMFSGYCRSNPLFVASLSGRPPGADCSDLFDLSVDLETSTLFVKKEWSLRVGFYVLDGVEEPPPI